MTKAPFTAVITTIQPPTMSMRILAEKLLQWDATMLVVGDQKGPASYDLPQCHLMTLDDQRAMCHELANLLPVGHYSRKNLGYLEAIRGGAPCIYETDDDNAPSEFWSPRQQQCEAQRISCGTWLNVYRLFSSTLIWPRGFPLDHIRDTATFNCDRLMTMESVSSPIQQGLADKSPDVDAVWRLVLDDDFCFDRGPSVSISPGTWCPFNSQTTWWWPDAYPLLYLPSFCSFRMTDIWRSFVAQRCLWEMEMGVVFHPAEVIQDRNPHDLMRDFKDEIPGYNGNSRLVDVLLLFPQRNQAYTSFTMVI